jgi:biotin carboxyl carrier protein
MKLFAHSNDSKHEIDIVEEEGHIVLKLGRESFVVNLDDQPGVIRTALFSGGKKKGTRKIEFAWTRNNGSYNILIDGIAYEVEVRDARAEKAAELAGIKAESSGSVEVRAPIPGRITKILLAEGSPVEKKQAVLTLDAMKLENEIQAPREGTVRSLSVKPGTAVDKGQLLFIIE